MLVLTRRPGEQIVIGDGIRLTVVSVGPGRVKIGIDAPADVRIDRQEIHDKILHEQAEHGSDVLAAVGQSMQSGEAGATMVNSAGDTSTALPSQGTEKPQVIAKPEAVAAGTAAGLRPHHRPAPYRLPRKSR